MTKRIKYTEPASYFPKEIREGFEKAAAAAKNKDKKKTEKKK